MLKTAALKTVKMSAAAVDVVRPRARGLVVLLYHRVGGKSGLQVDLPAELFDMQMNLLAESMTPVSLDDGLRWLDEPDPSVKAPVVVTFDDGTEDLVELALPILERHRVPATIYVATDFIERGIDFPYDGKPASWSSLSEAVATGLITIGSHTHTHALMDRLSEERIEEELNSSIGLIEDRLGVRADHFAYPKAVLASPVVEAAVRARFRSAALGGNRPNLVGSTDLCRLARSSVQVADGMRWFHKKLEGGMAFEETLRRSLNRLRYARATT